jgi:predicted neutral ceramidase superfamily lipid hydrolase
MRLDNRIRNSFVSAAIIVSISAIILTFIKRNNTDGVSRGLGIYFYFLTIICAAVTLGISFLSIDLLKIKIIKRSLPFIFIATLNTLTGISGLIISLIWPFDKIAYLIPFTICLLIGLLMFYRTDK